MEVVVQLSKGLLPSKCGDEKGGGDICEFESDLLSICMEM
jgi:hypothetical protein